VNIDWQVTSDDKARVKELMEKQGKTKIVRDRYDRNLAERKPQIIKDRLWRAMVCMRLTTRAPSGPGTRLAIFQSLPQFPLSCDEMRRQQTTEHFIHKTFTTHKVGTDPLKAAKQLAENFNRLEDGEWLPTLDQCNRLVRLERRETEAEVAAHIQKFDGFGLKQSRNVLQALGLTRYEIPLDSRVTNWLNKELRFPFYVESSALSCKSYYGIILDAICKLCEECGIVPCVLDAAIFGANDVDVWSVEELRY